MHSMSHTVTPHKAECRSHANSDLSGELIVMVPRDYALAILGENFVYQTVEGAPGYIELRIPEAIVQIVKERCSDAIMQDVIAFAQDYEP